MPLMLNETAGPGETTRIAAAAGATPATTPASSSEAAKTLAAFVASSGVRTRRSRPSWTAHFHAMPFHHRIRVLAGKPRGWPAKSRAHRPHSNSFSRALAVKPVWNYRATRSDRVRSRLIAFAFLCTCARGRQEHVAQNGDHRGQFPTSPVLGV